MRLFGFALIALGLLCFVWRASADDPMGGNNQPPQIVYLEYELTYGSVVMVTVFGQVVDDGTVDGLPVTIVCPAGSWLVDTDSDGWFSVEFVKPFSGFLPLFAQVQDGMGEWSEAEFIQ